MGMVWRKLAAKLLDSQTSCNEANSFQAAVSGFRPASQSRAGRGRRIYGEEDWRLKMGKAGVGSVRMRFLRSKAGRTKRASEVFLIHESKDKGELFYG
jgi:hypothetical protein